MDIVKYGRTKVKVGDCVSVPSSYFGAEYQREIHKALASKCSRIYGRVTCVRDGNRHFDVTWDVDGEVTRAMCLDNVNYEPHDTPPQKVDASTSVITMEDFEELAGSLEQCSSSKAAKEHALLYEDFVEPIFDTLYTLFHGDGNSRIDCMSAHLVPCAPGTVVHNKKMLPTEDKFQIVEVLNDDEDEEHCSGAFVVWDKGHVSIRSENGSEYKKNEGRKNAKKSKGKEKQIKKKTTCKTDESEEEDAGEDEEEEEEEEVSEGMWKVGGTGVLERRSVKR